MFIMERKKAFIIPFPQHGHINPMLSMTKELINKHHFDVIFYGLDDRREAIENTGATYRKFKHFNLTNFPKMPDLVDVFTYQLKVSNQELPTLLEDYIRDQPDVIIYDFMSLHGKFLLKFIRKKKCLKQPLGVNFNPTFALKPGIFPTDEEWSEAMNKNFWDIIRLVWLFILQAILSIKFRLNIWNTMKFFTETDELNLVGISPEFQPKREYFGNELKFVGHSASDQIQKAKIISDKKLEKILDSIDVINPSFDLDQRTEKVLIFASLGTVFNDFKQIFDKILDAFKLFESEDPSLKSFLIMSVGHTVFEEYKDYQCPDNMIILPYVPQINVLEKASLFITHGGMGSTNEAIYFAVPLIFIPMSADQPFVAKRLCDDFNLGIRFKPFDFTSPQLKDGMVKIINDHTYRQRTFDFSKILNKYNGGKMAADEIAKFIDERDKKQK
uniref:UDP-glucuronosyltransferase-like protein 5 n=1 Tax=Brachionus rotundiformis TaxID=96890 RepID=A0A7H9SLG5_9BILA|nr:UDP-glucuronosyltransferase-like protein 5 [Brachionus rotundiformis]